MNYIIVGAVTLLPCGEVTIFVYNLYWYVNLKMLYWIFNQRSFQEAPPTLPVHPPPLKAFNSIHTQIDTFQGQILSQCTT